MARQARLAIPGLAHYVHQRVVHGQTLAVDDEDRRSLLEILKEVSLTNDTDVWAYALAAHGLHLLLKPSTAESLARVMQALGRRYVASFNRRHGRQGALWGSRYRSTVVEQGEWLLSTMLFIDGLLPEESAWSSRHHRTGQVRDPLLNDPPEVWGLGNTPFEREQGYRDRLMQGTSNELESRLAASLKGGWVLGTPAFVAHIEELTGRPAAPRARGRPKRLPVV